ncbi:MAG: hypothetical protein DLM57_04580 [Pseudonocardiales bacterium]|nr:MAG: hypothetical protein DLM57_04580 [Pseudonocardiales bacterium]
MPSDDQLINQIVSTIQKIENLVKQLVDTINTVLSFVPFFLKWVVDVVKRGMDRFFALLKQFWDWMSNILSHMGSPSAVSATANAWSDHVGAPVSAEVGNADQGALMVDDNWTGRAAGIYKSILGPQKSALAAIKTTFTDGIALVLSQFRTAIWVFWGALIAAVGILVAGVIAGLASADTILGLPATPVLIIGAVALCAASCFTGAEILKSAAASANTQLRARLDDSTAFPGNKWPSGVLH